MSLALQRFEGPSVEAALGAAANALGPTLTVHEARRVRKGGLLGFFAREHVEVVAERAASNGSPVATPAGQDHDGVTSALRSLVEEVEAQETVMAAVEAAPVQPLDDVLVDLRRERTAIEVGGALSEPTTGTGGVFTDADLAPLPDPFETVEAESVEMADVVDAATAAAGDATFYDFELLDAEELERLPRWTRKSLREIGIPDVVLRSLPQNARAGDLGWTRALERAIAKHVPPPMPLNEENPAQISGYGPEGAVSIIRGGVWGLTPGALHIDGRRVPATATELALAVRSCLPR